MKKILKKIISFILVLVIFSSTNFVFSAKNTSGCKIESTPEYITKYIKNIRKVISNVNKTAISKKKERDEKNKNILNGKSNNKNYSKAYWAINSMFTWKWYELNFEYSVWENTKEIPNQLKRDIRILTREKDNLVRFYEKFAKKSLSDEVISNEEACKGIDNSEEVCNIYMNSSDNAINILTKLQKSLNNLILQIKNNSVGKNFKKSNDYFLLNKNETNNNLKRDYWEKSLESCNKSEWNNSEKGFLKTIIDAIKNISLTWKKGSENTNDWQKAIELLWWSFDNKEYAKKERELLKWELQKQWIWWDWASAVMWNLDAYNKNWEILWGKDWFLNSLQSQINGFEEIIKIERKKSVNRNLSVKDFDSKIWNIRESEKIKIEINSKYLILKKLAEQDDNTNKTLINRMIKMHLNISEWINTLNKSCEISVKVCREQKKWEWDCGQCY